MMLRDELEQRLPTMGGAHPLRLAVLLALQWLESDPDDAWVDAFDLWCEITQPPEFV